MFEDLLNNIKVETVRFLSHIQVASEEDMQKLEEQRRREQEGREYQHAATESLTQEGSGEAPRENQPQTQKPMQRQGPKVGRNDPCPCGSGKKFKQCHGKI